jgi:hypothetical protein
MRSTTLKFSVSFKESSLFFSDQTEKYNISRNKTGWGRPNTELSSVNKTEIHLYLPSSTTPIVYYPAVESLPSVSCDPVEITAKDFGLEIFEPGVYRVDYVVYHSNLDVPISLSKSFFHIGSLQCCIDKKKLSIDFTDTESKVAREVIEGETLISNANKAFELCRYDDVNKILNYLRHKCDCNC